MELRESVAAALEAAQVPATCDPDVCASFGTDWTGRFSGPVLAVAHPSSTDQVVATMAVAERFGVPVVPQGGNTGLVGSSVPSREGPAALVLRTTSLRRLDEVDRGARAVTVGAGVTLAELQQHARAAGLQYGVDLAARDSATVGGTVATNAGGIRVCAYGMTREQVLGVEAVLADGTVVSRLTGLRKDNTGYDLAGLLTGSEGTLGVICAVRLRLHEAPPDSQVALLQVASLAEGLAAAEAVVPPGATLLAAEIMDRATVQLVCEATGAPPPFVCASPFTLLLEASELVLSDDAVAVVSMDAADRRHLWSYRERASESASSRGVVHKLDVSVPLTQLDALIEGVREKIPDDVELLTFGHLADGNLHLELIGADPGDDALDNEILQLVVGLGGAVSAEHGVGRAKAQALLSARGGGDIDTMRRIKSALDPKGLLNPGALLPRRQGL